MSDVADLTRKKCKPCEGGTPPLAETEAARLLSQLQGWARSGEGIEKLFPFKDHYQTLAFVNAVAWVSHREDHHPDLTVGYNQCRVFYITHAAQGLTENDFICAAKVDALFAL